jgi:acyl-coenzyme A thioesterase PaaI-like protein
MTVWEAGARLDEATRARRAAGKAVRDLGHALVGHQCEPALLDEVAGTLNELTVRLDAGERRSRPVSEFADRSRSMPTGVAVESYDDRPFSGEASPWGLDLEVHRFGDTIQAELTLRAAHEGAPGRSHGGIVAGLFDDVFGFVLGTIQEPAFTGELSIRYERPTPLHRRLRCTGRLVRRDDRKLWIAGELIDLTVEGQPVVARGEGLFITVDPQVFRLASQELPAPAPE